MKLPPLRYADNDGVSIGYRTTGEGHDVFLTSGATVAMDSIWRWARPIAEFARFTIYDNGPSRAVECARRAHGATAEIGLAIRAGLHAGRLELRADDVAGMGAHIAARVSGLASAVETIVSRTVKDLVVGLSSKT